MQELRKGGEVEMITIKAKMTTALCFYYSTEREAVEKKGGGEDGRSKKQKLTNLY